MLQAQKASSIQKLIRILRMPDANVSWLRRFVQLHGVVMLKLWMRTRSADSDAVYSILELLKTLPISTRNTVQNCKLDLAVTELTSHEDERISSVASQLLDDWAGLKEVYRIPKAKISSTDVAAPGESSPSSSISSEPRSRGSMSSSHGEASSATKRPRASPDDAYGGGLSYRPDRRPTPLYASMHSLRPASPEYRNTLQPMNGHSEHASESTALAGERSFSMIEGIAPETLQAVLDAAKMIRPLAPLSVEKNQKQSVKEFRDAVSAIVVKKLSKLKDKMDVDTFKHHARKVCHPCEQHICRLD